MSNVVHFGKPKGSDLDDVVMCTIEVNGRGDVSLVVNAWDIETEEQHNWLVAKVSEAVSRLIDRKKDMASNQPMQMSTEAPEVFDHPIGFVRMRERHRVKAVSRRIAENHS